MQNTTIAFIGTGNMAKAMIIGLIQNGFLVNNIWASSPSIEKSHRLQSHGIHLTSDNVIAAKNADVIVLAVKPFVMQSVCEELKNIFYEKKPLLISLATGVTINSISKWIEKENYPIVRTMPNIASAVGAGETGLFANAFVDESQKMIAESVFRSVGATLWLLDENQLDVITAISGSGPAYLFYIFEAMQKAAMALGITTEDAKLLVSQTAVGAAKMVMESNDSFEQLRQFVTSEKGTTAAAIDIFNQHDTQNIIKKAIEAALKRAKELGT